MNQENSCELHTLCAELQELHKSEYNLTAILA